MWFNINLNFFLIVFITILLTVIIGIIHELIEFYIEEFFEKQFKDNNDLDEVNMRIITNALTVSSTILIVSIINYIVHYLYPKFIHLSIIEAFGILIGGIIISLIYTITRQIFHINILHPFQKVEAKIEHKRVSIF